MLIHRIPQMKEGEWTLKTALQNATRHGTRLELLVGRHGPFNTLHSFPEEHDEGRVWYSVYLRYWYKSTHTDTRSLLLRADTLCMLTPCHLIGGQREGGVSRSASEGETSTHVEATLSIICGTLGVVVRLNLYAAN
jgi:hypothetical protein